MDLLLDTHAFLWFITGDKQLSEKGLAKITNPANKCYVSFASVLEIVIKYSSQKLEIDGGFHTIEDFLENNDVEILPINIKHTKYLLKLELHHRDPFDRMIISQAITEKLTIITKDKYFEAYNVKLFW